jgi:DNA topoisomerase I
MSVLFIVESPNKAKSIQKYFPDFKVVATVGHFRDLPVNELGVDEATHRPTYVTVDGKEDLVRRLKTAAKQAQQIYLATDPDREGEAIAAHIAHTIGKQDAGKVHRVTYQEVTKKAILEAIKNKRQIDWKLVKAQEGRRILDRYVGYLVSPELTAKFRCVQQVPFLSAGRVQSVALRLIVERAEAIERFVPVEHFGVRATLERGECRFVADWYLVGEDGNPQAGEIKDKSLAKSVVDNTNTLKLVDVKKQRVRVSPPAPLTTSSYIKLVSRRFKVTTKQAMDVAQKLFEQGLITYHRTDSPYMSADFVERIRMFAKSQGLPLPAEPRQYKAKANAQEAHECLRVTDISNDRVMLDDPLQVKIYRQIWEITLGCQLADGADEVTRLFWLNGRGDRFLTRGSIVIDPGFRKMQGFELEDGDTQDDNKQRLPVLNLGDVIKPSSVELQTKHTQPPKLFTEETLVGQMEKMGIGRPATYASVIEVLVKREYVVRDPKKLQFTPQPLGRALVMAARDNFSFLDFAYTANAEEKFDLIAQGKLTYDHVIRDAHQHLRLQLEQFKTAHLSAAVIEIVKQAPQTQAPKKQATAANARSGKASAKTGNAKKTTNANTQNPPSGSAACPKCGEGHLIRRQTKSDSNPRQFYGCSKYPGCNYTENIPLHGETASVH